MHLSTLHDNIRSLAFAVVLGAVAPFGSGCYGRAAAAYGYEPAYYDGYVVYYDGGGGPIYYYNGAAMFIPPTSPTTVGTSSTIEATGRTHGRWTPTRAIATGRTALRRAEEATTTRPPAIAGLSR